MMNDVKRITRKSGRTVKIKQDVVTKSDAPSRMTVEVEKTRRAREIGKHTGLFAVPEVVRFDEKTGIATFQYVPDLLPFVQCSKVRGGYKHLAPKVGRALAAVHQHLVLPEVMKEPLPKEFDKSGPKAFVHGDFNGLNVCITPDGSIVIIDWAFTDVLGGAGTYGSRYSDVAFFVRYMCWHFRLSPSALFSITPATHLFVKEYEKATGLSDQYLAISDYCEHFFNLMKPYGKVSRSRRTRYLRSISNHLEKRFIRTAL